MYITMAYGLISYQKDVFLPIRFLPEIMCEDAGDVRDEIVEYNLLHAGRNGPVSFGVVHNIEVVPCSTFLPFLEHVCCYPRHRMDHTQECARHLAEAVKALLNNANKRTESRRLRSKIAADQRWDCAMCKERLPPHFEIDHIHELHLGGTDTPDNLQALCPRCHKQKTFDVQYERDIKRLFGIVIPEQNPFQKFVHNTKPSEGQPTIDTFLENARACNTELIIANLRRENAALRAQLKSKNNLIMQ